MCLVRQEPESAALNADYSAGEHYAHEITLDTFRHIGSAIDREVEGTELLLDVGNGGVFRYDTRRVGRIVAVDVSSTACPRRISREM